MDQKSWQQQLSAHFTRFTKHGDEFDTLELNRLHYLYAASRFAVCCLQAGRAKLLPEDLVITPEEMARDA